MSRNTRTEKMSLYELGKEYEKHAELQKSFIAGCKAEIKKAEMSGDFDAVVTLKERLRKFREIKRELEETASTLKTYYKGEQQ